MVNRILVRPKLAEVKERFASRSPEHEPQNRPHGGNGSPVARRRTAPPDQTNAEAFYYLKQMNTATPMVVVLDDGEQLRGHIEWYDKTCLKVHREGSPNLLVFKHCIRYLYKQEEEVERPKAGKSAS
jgi:sRNA-binding regulator protein Hfq